MADVLVRLADPAAGNDLGTSELLCCGRIHPYLSLDPEGSPKRSFRTLSPVENGGAFSLMTPTSEGPISRIGIGNARGMSGTDAHHRELGNRGPAIRIELAIGNGTQSLALGPDWRWLHVNSWRVVIGDRRSLTIGAGSFEAIRYKVPGLRHGQQVGPPIFC
jgi:hypothetical protein